MRLLALALIGCASTASPSYPLHPKLRPASGGPITFVGEVAHPGVIPYSPGITFTTALRLAGGPTGLANNVQVRRGNLFFGLPLWPILDHQAPDPELAPGDVITFENLD